MLVIVFYREAVPINQEVATILIGFDKEIENALLARNLDSLLESCVCVCVYVYHAYQREGEGEEERKRAQLVFYSTLYMIRTFHLATLRPRNA